MSQKSKIPLSRIRQPSFRSPPPQSSQTNTTTNTDENEIVIPIEPSQGTSTQSPAELPEPPPPPPPEQEPPPIHPQSQPEPEPQPDPQPKPESDHSYEDTQKSTNPFRHFRFKEIDDELDRTFGLTHTNDSTILDIIVVYVKGQKILYTEAKTLCEQRLNALMIPAIFNTAISTILSLVLKDLSFGATIVSVLNGINALFLSLITYLKLDARAEAHRTSAYKFDKLQSFLEFNSGKVLFTLPTEDNKEEYNIYQIIKIAEREIREIKETNQFILPERIRFKFPMLYGTNVFSIVKSYMNEDMIRVNKFKDQLNKKQDILKKMAVGGDDEIKEIYTYELSQIDEKCKRMLNDIIDFKKEYLKIDQNYQREIEQYKKNSRMSLCDWLKS